MRGLKMIAHCLEWYKLALRARLPTPAVLYLVINSEPILHFYRASA